ncbi:MAG: murein hydrolase activator EnvC family protein [Burkholderiales bacterium]
MIVLVRAVALAGTVALLWAAPAWASQAPGEELKALRARLEKLKRDIARSEGSRSEAADALEASEVAISTAGRKLDALAASRREVEANLAELDGEAQSLRARLAEQRALAARLVYQHYTNAGTAGAFEILAGAPDLNALARDRVYLDYLARARKAVLDRLVARADRLRELTEEATQRRQELAVIEDQEAAQRARLETERVNRKQVLAKLSSKIERQRREAGSLERDERRLAKLVQDLAKMLAARKPAPRSAPSTRSAEPRTGAPFEHLKGRLHAPVRGQVTERFGTPRADSGLSWRGLFIEAPAGREVKAVAAGRVVFADWLRGFGNLLIVDHGDGFMSLYGNNETLMSQVGEPVRGGETVATVGSTGGNTASGLYFELRYQGKPFDPLGWLNLK